MQNTRNFEENQVIGILDDFEKKLKEYVSFESHSLLSGLFDFYTELLISCSLYYDVTPYIARFLNEFFVEYSGYTNI